ncbi:hypothetical protein [Kitasatospora sp. DSM 101779]|uniref:Rv1733c family protein n=1 Tax=Kitasatospora sp. DSM 101779 TaxID=2853165 RepID=UPI0021D87409|nr:hypothetical protein [Kitasatospora sp. DSM 101779]MCU7826459.1 hypothetical protein [Kitasatospora sp. DSM 101779]
MPAASTGPCRPEAGRPVRSHLRRAAGLDHNPLCRRVDRARSRLLVGAVLLAVLSVAAALVTAQVLLHDMRADARRTAEHRHPATATTLATAAGIPGRPLDTVGAPATWTVAGANRTGTVAVPSGTPQGTKVPIWVDDAGTVAEPAPADSQLAVSAASFGLMALAAAGTVSTAVFVLRGGVLDHRAADAWEDDWTLVEPLWSGRTDRPGKA